MAKFKCVHSGCVYEWTEPEMVANMQAHDEYVELTEEEPAALVPVVKESPKPKSKKEVK